MSRSKYMGLNDTPYERTTIMNPSLATRTVAATGLSITIMVLCMLAPAALVAWICKRIYRAH